MAQGLNALEEAIKYVLRAHLQDDYESVAHLGGYRQSV